MFIYSLLLLNYIIINDNNNIFVIQNNYMIYVKITMNIVTITLIIYCKQ